MTDIVDTSFSEIEVIVDDINCEALQRIASLMDEVELDILQLGIRDSRNKLIFAFNDLALAYLISNNADSIVGHYSESHYVPSLCKSIKKILGVIEQNLRNDKVFLHLTKKMRQNLLIFYQQEV